MRTRVFCCNANRPYIVWKRKGMLDATLSSSHICKKMICSYITPVFVYGSGMFIEGRSVRPLCWYMDYTDDRPNRHSSVVLYIDTKLFFCLIRSTILWTLVACSARVGCQSFHRECCLNTSQSTERSSGLTLYCLLFSSSIRAIIEQKFALPTYR